MKEYRVIKEFYDATDNNKKYVVGDIYTCDEKRAIVLMGKNKNKKKYIDDVEVKENTDEKKEEKKSFRRRMID